MRVMQFVKPVGAIAALGLIGFAAMSIISPRVQAGYLGGGRQFGPFPGKGIGGVGPLITTLGT